MNINPIKSIYNYNKDRGLLDAGYSDERECAFPIEEALEGTNDLVALADILNIKNDGTDSDLPKHISREIMSIVHGHAEAPDIPDVDRLDKHLDIIVYSFGSIFKLGLTPQQAMKGLQIVMEANMAKSNKVDEAGKNIKGDAFIPPEERLQKLLDER